MSATHPKRPSIFRSRGAVLGRGFPPTRQHDRRSAPSRPAAPPPALGERPVTDLGRPALAGLLAITLLVGGLGGWALSTVISGAVIARGEAVVDGRAKLVQHPDGGIVETIAVDNGSTVSAGQVLMTLKPDLVATDLDIARTRLSAALALRARLMAEQAGTAALAPLDVTGLPPLPNAVLRTPLALDAQFARQTEIFAARADVRQSGAARLVETQAQIDAQISGIEGQIKAAEAQIASLEGEIEAQEGLLERGLARQSGLNDLLRARADLSGRRAQLISEIARLETSRREAEIATEQSEQEFREDVATELGAITTEIEELIRTIVTRQGELDRMEIRAPAAGVVHELAVSTEGGVVAPGDTLMQIVPQNGALKFEVRVDPVSIDQIHPGQAAELVLSAFDPNTTPRLAATVETVSAAAIADPQTGGRFYRVDLTVAPSALAAASALDVVPGMPVEAYLRTSDRTVLGYLIEPFAGHVRRAFRE